MPHKRIALTGGIATGKTTVANRLRELGAIILDADQYARQAVEPGAPSHDALRRIIGARYFDAHGTLRRDELRRRIIRDPALRARIDAVLHPYIMRAMGIEWEKQKSLHPRAVIVFDIPLLFEGGLDKNFDIIILAYCTHEVQLQRLIERDKLDPSEAELTLSMQFPIDSKRAHSNYIIENSGDLDQTLRQVDEVWDKILERQSSN
ncbi:MAG TPA: dephospho-CoA kinase [Syntrophobacteraceae bacterium]|nr:dephospho-CoA kinase [Syntrophobacteraceae bacterium]